MLPPELFQLIADFCWTKDALAISSVNKEVRDYFSLTRLSRPRRLVPHLVRNLQTLDLSESLCSERQTLISNRYLEGAQAMTRERSEPEGVIRERSELEAKREWNELDLVPNLTSLDLYNSHYTDIRHLTKLKKLKISYSQVRQEDIDPLNPEELDCSGMELDISHMTNLRRLTAEPCKLTGLDKLTGLEVLNYGGRRTPDLACFSRLRVLDCGNSITQWSIRHLPSLEELYCRYNDKITDVTHLTNLKVLIAPWSKITQEGLIGLDLTWLDCSYNGNINDVSIFPNLVWLQARGDTGIKSITNPKLEKLFLGNNLVITDVSHLTSLKVLEISDTYITQEGIRGLDLIELHCLRTKLEDISWMTNLIRLYAFSTPLRCIPPSVKTLHLNSPHITSISHLTELEIVALADPSPIPIRDYIQLPNLKYAFHHGSCNLLSS